MRTVCVLLFCVIASIVSAVPANGQDDRTDPAAAPDYFTEATVSDPTPYVGQQILYTVRYYAYSLDRIFEADPVRFPDFDRLWVNNIYDSGIRIETVEGVQYNVGEFRIEITALEAGPLRIAPTALVVEDTLFLEGGSVFSEAIQLDVQPLPADSPSGFNGAVGQFSMDAQIDNLTVDLGQPIALIMDIQGTGNFELLPRPDLDLGANWRVLTTPPDPPLYATTTVGGVRLGQKVFEWLVIPQRTGTLPLEPIQFVYFDPEQNQYITLDAPDFTINVFAGDGSVEAITAEDFNPERLPENALKPLPAVLISQGDPLQLPIWFWLAWLLPPVAAAIVAGWQLTRRRSTVEAARRRQKAALRLAQQRLNALSGLTPQETGDRLRRITLAYIADRLNFPNRAVNTPLLDDLLTEQLGEDSAQVVLPPLQTCLNEADSLRYLPGDLEMDPAASVQRVAAALHHTDHLWDKPV
ncbi:MAG: BatD family protein [Chloroflexota bacterium]